jgi:dipeptidase
MSHYPAGTHATGTMRRINEFGTGLYLGEIPEAPTTYNVIGNMNEHQVAIGETTFGGLASLASQPGAVIDYYSLMWLALQRSTTAREAILTMDQLCADFGYASTGESFSVSDPNEVWHVDWIGKGAGHKGAVWVARRLPDNTASAHANQARITTWPWNDPANGTMWAADVVTFAVEKKLYPAAARPQDFSFADVYDPLTVIGARLCEARVWDLFRHIVADGDAFAAEHLDYAQGRNLTNRMPLWVAVGKPISVNTTMWLMRGHYEGTWFDDRQLVGAGPYHSPYRARPLTFKHGGAEYAFNRNLGYVGTFFHFVAQARSNHQHSNDAAAEAGGIIWFGVDDASFSVRTPMYASATQAPLAWAYGNGDTGHFAPRAAFWVFNVVANFAYTRHSVVGDDVRATLIETERRLQAAVPKIDAAAAAIARASGKQAAVAYLTNYSVVTADAIVDQWAALFPALFTK